VADPLSLESLLKDPLIQPSLNYPSTDALSVVAARLSHLDLAPEIVYAIDTVEKSALPHLMDQFNVLLYESWAPNPSEALRRNLISRSIEFHKSKGTLAGIKKHVAITGAEVVNADVADNKFYAGESITSEEFTAWKQNFPEIRIYDFIEQSVDVVSAVPGPALGWVGSFLGSSTEPTFFCGDRGVSPDTGRKAVLIKDGITTDLIWSAVIEDDVFEQLRIPGDPGKGYFLDNVLYQDCLGDTIPGERVMSYRRVSTETYAGYQHNLLTPGITPLTIAPEKIYEGSVDEVGLYADAPWEGHWMVESTVHLRTYDSIRLFDQEHRIPLAYSTAYLDAVRFPVDPYTAELRTRIQGVKPQSAFEFVDDFLVEDQLSTLNNALDAIEVSQAFRDQLYVSTKTHKPVQFGDRKKFGQFSFGDWTEI
jgi:hypothetical protein